MTFDADSFQKQIARMASEAENKSGPIQMLNMIRFRDIAEYREHEAPEGEPPSGREAYGTYSADAAAFVASVGGSLTWMSAESTMIIGPPDTAWHAVFAVRYPNRAAFVEMITNPDYQAITHHRTAAVADSRLIMMEISED